ncbi:MAG TPA: lytic transglycosylase domain-containing protein [Thermoanaerobaculia bacterium]|nr:lytic transglycosylase domain-containing protein [Thermoanaerobaculia bacterium]
MSEEHGRKIFFEGEEGEGRSGFAPMGALAEASPTLLRKSSSLPLFLFVVLAFLFAAAPAAATLVVFEDGRHVRVVSYEVVAGDGDGGDERVSMKLVGGGSMTVSLDVVDRIVDDEYERLPAPKDGVPSAAETGASAGRSVRAFSENPSVSSPYSRQILEAAKQHRVDPALIAAVIRAESNGVPTAVSRKGARGLMQLMPATARRLGVRSPFDPKENIRGGTAYLAELAARYGDTRADLVLAAYNAGERAVDEHKGVPPFRETREYVRKVLAFWAGAQRIAAASF